MKLLKKKKGSLDNRSSNLVALNSSTTGPVARRSGLKVASQELG